MLNQNISHSGAGHSHYYDCGGILDFFSLLCTQNLAVSRQVQVWYKPLLLHCMLKCKAFLSLFIFWHVFLV